MPCFSRLQARRFLLEDGSSYVEVGQSYTESQRERVDGLPDNCKRIQIACGQCKGCRFTKAQVWAHRCVHEASLHERNCFVTLTYDDEHLAQLPVWGSLFYRDFQLFMMRLRKRYGSGVRMFMCGEYGDKFGRPHFHALLFNHDFADRELFKVVRGVKTDISDELSSLWDKGFSTVGDMTWKSSAYVARYAMKKINGRQQALAYQRATPEGELVQVEPEFNRMSLKPGIAKGWYDKYKFDVYPKDYFMLGDKRRKPPRYYDGCFEIDCPDIFAGVKAKRQANAEMRTQYVSPEILKRRKDLFESQQRLFQREVC